MRAFPPPDDGAGHRLRLVCHSTFQDAVTRMLLSSDGSTTRLLEATTAGPLSLRVLHQAVGAASRCPDTIRTALRLAPETQVVNRCSALVDAQSRTVSLNHVVAPFAPHSRLGDIVSGTIAAIGPELARRHVEHRRELVACGLALWPGASGPRLAAAKVYVIWHGDERLMYIREMFDPDVISPVTHEPVSPPGVEPAAAPRPLPRGRDAVRAVGRPDETAHGRARLEAMPGLVTSTECDVLRSALALAAAGRGFVIEVGDSAETFGHFTQESVEARHALIRLLTTAAECRMGVPVAAVSRMIGAQVADDALLQEYLHSAALLRALHNADQHADFRWIRWLRDRLGDRKEHDPQIAAVIAETDFALQFATPGSGWPRTYVSRRVNALDYERALVRADSAGRPHGSSGHLLRIDDGTRDLAGAHVAFAASIANPVAVILGPGAEPRAVLDLCRLLDPAREPGRLALITRMGADRLREALPGLLRAVEDAGHPVAWICDPMHAATAGTASRGGTRPVDDVLAEITVFFDAHSHAGTHPGGLHLEAAAQDVAEYDRRLHPLEALECVLHAAGGPQGPHGRSGAR